jgi:hypothetical protein
VHEATTESALLVAAATQRAPKLATVAQHLPLGVCQIVDTALLFDRGARYPDAKTMQADVRAAQRGQAPPFAMGHAQALDAPTRSDGDQVLSAFPVAAPASATFGGQAVTQSIEDSPSGFRVGPLALLLGVAFAAGLAWMLTSERGEVTPEASEPSKDSDSSLAAASVEGEEHQEEEGWEEEEERQEPVEEQRGALQENSRQVLEPAPEEQQPAPQVERQGGKRQREHAREDKKWRKERERKSKR